MRITVFTSNQPRHLSLIRDLAGIADEVFAVQECNTVFPGLVGDFYKKSQVMQDYFGRVIAAEREVFGGLAFSPANVRHLAIKSGDLNMVDLAVFDEALAADYFVVFGASYIKGPLVEALVARRAINIHMGVSPYYRGNSCNFWAIYDRNPDLVGATIHLLSKGLDSGAMLFHALPRPAPVDPFVFGMQAVRAAHRALVERLREGDIFAVDPVAQDRTREIRYTRNRDFTDEVAAEYLGTQLPPQELARLIAIAPQRELLRPSIL